MKKETALKILWDNCIHNEETKEAYKVLKNDTRPQGEWIFRSGVTCGGYYKCNKCGEVERAEKNFCSNCGARMRGENE